MKTVFTTGEAATICKVSQQTIIRCFDTGQLKGFRVPGSRFRRIPRDMLYKFMKDNGIPTDALGGEVCKVMLVGLNPVSVGLVSNALPERFEMKDVGSDFEAGLQIMQFQPDVVVVDWRIGAAIARDMPKALRGSLKREDLLILALADETEVKGGGVLDVGYDRLFQKPLDPQLLFEYLRVQMHGAVAA